MSDEQKISLEEVNSITRLNARDIEKGRSFLSAIGNYCGAGIIGKGCRLSANDLYAIWKVKMKLLFNVLNIIL